MALNMSLAVAVTLLGRLRSEPPPATPHHPGMAREGGGMASKSNEPANVATVAAAVLGH